MHKIKPIFVFDGAELPMKSGTEKKRDDNRNNKIADAEKLLAEGNVEAANKKFAEAIDITPKHAYALIYALEQLGITYYVAPYEADAQLAYLVKEGIADVVFTEDSDLLPFGANKVFLKMDKNGYGFEICLNDLKKVTEMSMQNIDQNMFLSI